MTGAGWALTLLQTALFIAGAPLLAGWLKQVKCRLQNRRAPPLWQPYRNLAKLFGKEAVAAETASPLFRTVPYVAFAMTTLAAATVPLITVYSPTTAIADVIVLVGLLSVVRFFMALGAMDIGTAFGGMGASRDTAMSSLAEPAMLMAIFTLAMTAHSTDLAASIQQLLQAGMVLRPSFLFALLGLLLVAVAETGRIPVDNPAAHLELTMIHEAMVLEYSGRHLALLEWTAQLKLMIFGVLIADVFFPWGMAVDDAPAALLAGTAAVTAKLALLGVALVVV